MKINNWIENENAFKRRQGGYSLLDIYVCPEVRNRRGSDQKFFTRTSYTEIDIPTHHIENPVTATKLIKCYCFLMD